MGRDFFIAPVFIRCLAIFQLFLGKKKNIPIFLLT